MSLRRKIYEVIEVADKDDRDSLIYDRFMLVCIAASIVPLCFKETNSLFIWLGRIVSMTSSFMGIAIVALPTGIITAGYMRELSREKWD
ncbi:MAG: hypothetical protein Q3X57_04045 [Oscillospiraceae bacterium]|jgi:hypothetical protein|nr:hypothetical protein [Oscillospiraceae bacterium]